MAELLDLSDSAVPSPKYAQILATAEDLFTRYGVKRVTVEEICQTADVSKMTFYKFFKNKNDLATLLVRKIMDAGQKKFERIMEQDIPFQERIRQFIQFKLDYGKRFSKEFYRDFLGLTPEIRELIGTRSRQNMDYIAKIFRAAQKKGEIRKDLNMNLVQYMLNNAVEISNDPRLLEIYPDMYSLAKDWLNFFFYGIMEARDETADN